MERCFEGCVIFAMGICRCVCVILGLLWNMFAYGMSELSIYLIFWEFSKERRWELLGPRTDLDVFYRMFI